MAFATWVCLKSVSEALGVFSLYAIVHQLVSKDRAVAVNKLLEYIGSNPDPKMLSGIYSAAFITSTIIVISSNYFMNQYYGFLVHRTSSDTLSDKFATSGAISHSVTDVKDVIVESENLVLGLFVPAVRILSDSLTVFTITALLFIVQPTITVTAIIFFVFVYTTLQYIFSKPTVNLGAQRVRLEEERMVAAHNVIYGKADIRNTIQYKNIMSEFNIISTKYNFITALRKTIPSIMKKALEAVLFLLISFVLFLELESTNINNSLYLFGAAFLRLMPAISSILAEKNQVSFYSGLIDKIPQAMKPIFFSEKVERIQLVGKRLFRGQKLIASNINLSIQRGDRVLVKGASGSGKSTLIRLAFGLDYERGFSLRVNSIPLEIGTVISDVIFLSNQSLLSPGNVYENIAFNTTVTATDKQNIESLCLAVGIHNEITSFEDGYNTRLGEQGAKVSLGQRQRILIARALFSGRTILVFDEMSNALDGRNKAQILDYLFSLPRDFTIVFITHDSISRKLFNREISIVNNTIFDNGIDVDANKIDGN